MSGVDIVAANENSEEIATTVDKLIQEAYELLADTINATKATDDRAKRQRVDWTDRHRLHVLLEAAEDTRRSLPGTIVAPWFLAELRATLDIVRRWQEKPCWQDIEKSLNDAESFAHTIAMLHIAEHLEWGGHKVEVVAEGEKPSITNPLPIMELSLRIFCPELSSQMPSHLQIQVLFVIILFFESITHIP